MVILNDRGAVDEVNGDAERKEMGEYFRTSKERLVFSIESSLVTAMKFNIFRGVELPSPKAVRSE